MKNKFHLWIKNKKKLMEKLVCFFSSRIVFDNLRFLTQTLIEGSCVSFPHRTSKKHWRSSLRFILCFLFIVMRTTVKENLQQSSI